MSILKLLASTSFITVNKVIAKELGMTEAIILGVLCSGYSYYESKGLLNGDFFPFSTEMLQEETTFGETAQRNAINHLIECGILEKKNFGTPQKRHFKINEDVLLQFLRNVGINSYAIKELNPTPSRNYINNNTIVTFNNKNSVEEYTKTDATKELSIDDQIAMTIEAWNSNKHIRTTIDRIPFGTKRYDRMMLTIAQFGWERFIEEIRSLDENGFFADWQPGFDWIVDPNNFMKLCDGNYRSGRRKETSDNGWDEEDRKRIERWLADDEE